MNHPTEQNQENSQTYISSLISLFEQKGYECEEIVGDSDTLYVMKYDVPSHSKPFEPKPKMTVL
jgi:hypothetical protein